MAGVVGLAVERVRVTLVDVLMKAKGGLKYVVGPEVVDGCRAHARAVAKRRRVKARRGGEAQPCPCTSCADARGEWGLFPKVAVQGLYYQFVSDHASVFSARQVVTMEMATRRTFERVRAPVAIVTMLELVNRRKMKKRVRRFAHGMFNTWRLGYKDWNYGVLVLYAVHDASIALVPGKAWSSAWTKLIADTEATLNHVLEMHVLADHAATLEYLGEPALQLAAYGKRLDEFGPPFNVEFLVFFARVLTALSNAIEHALLGGEGKDDDASSDSGAQDDRPGPSRLWPEEPKWRNEACADRADGRRYVIGTAKQEARERQSVLEGTVMPFESGLATKKPKGKGTVDLEIERRIAEM